jgi:hypothetical protein
MTWSNGLLVAAFMCFLLETFRATAKVNLVAGGLALVLVAWWVR